MQGSYLHESGVVKDIAVAANGQVTFTFGTKDLSGNFGFPMDDGDGTLSNGVKIFSEQSTMLNPVDAVDNKVKIASGIMTVELFDGGEFSALSAEKKAALKHALLHNSIRLGHNGEEFKLSDLLAEKNLSADTVTASQLKDAIVAKINSNKNAWNLQATINNGNIEITRTDASLATIYFNEVKGFRTQPRRTKRDRV